MRPCTRRIVPAEDVIKATSLNDVLGEHAPWCRTAPNAPLPHIKPLGLSSRWRAARIWPGRSGGIGRRTGLKIRRLKGRGGSIPPFGIALWNRKTRRVAGLPVRAVLFGGLGIRRRPAPRYIRLP